MLTPLMFCGSIWACQSEMSRTLIVVIVGLAADANAGSARATIATSAIRTRRSCLRPGAGRVTGTAAPPPERNFVTGKQAPMLPVRTGPHHSCVVGVRARTRRNDRIPVPQVTSRSLHVDVDPDEAMVRRDDREAVSDEVHERVGAGRPENPDGGDLQVLPGQDVVGPKVAGATWGEVAKVGRVFGRVASVKVVQLILDVGP